MGLLDIFSGITKKVNETDLSRKKEEIDSLYNEMLNITDKLTEAAKKIRDLKTKIDEMPSSSESTEKNVDNNTIAPESPSDETTDEQPKDNKETEEAEEGEGEEKEPEVESGATEPIVQAGETPEVKSDNTASINDSIFGSMSSELPGATQTQAVAPAVAPPAAPPLNMAPAQPGAMPTFSNFTPATNVTPAFGVTPALGATQPNPFGNSPVNNNNNNNINNNNIDNKDLQSDIGVPIISSNELGGGKKNRKTRSTNKAPRRKRRTRRNNKSMAQGQAQGQTQAQTQGQAQGQAQTQAQAAV